MGVDGGLFPGGAASQGMLDTTPSEGGAFSGASDPGGGFSPFRDRTQPVSQTTTQPQAGFDVRDEYQSWLASQQPSGAGPTGMSPDIARSQAFVDQMGQMDPSIYADLDPSRQAMQALGAMDPNVSADYEAIKNDPMYQFAMQEALRGQNRNLSAQNMLQSRAGADAVADTGMRVALNERDRIYAQNAANYGRAYGQGTDQYNMQNALAQQQYGVDTANYNRGYGQLQDQASMGNQLGGQQYQRLMGLSGIGQSAAGQMAASNQNLASGLSSAYMNQGNALAQGQLASGQIMGSGMANLGNALGYGVQQYNQPQQPSYSGSPFTTAANPLGLTPGQGL